MRSAKQGAKATNLPVEVEEIAAVEFVVDLAAALSLLVAHDLSEVLVNELACAVTEARAHTGERERERERERA